MDISPLGSSIPVTRLQGSKATTPATSAQDVPSQDAGTDTVEISDVARFLGEIKQLPDIRQDKVDNVKAALQNGTYQHTPDKIDAVVTGILNEWA